ncbi:MAG TPA: cytochrome d ubiquinol oxidase subunit II [Verrucomicrobiota bacterium]|jgi:cytochrome d ubiquinol oxidase subunit II|nr:cytochrome d ubiquinol oxidase subunit II [Verrucomicrobiota bacterium]HRT09595.1 cytochrome d ubiquinol oxidase subunit II [Candidatus Paceibacterota bacterium]HRT58368.1 cytochrome d ubiquinol oxidase subunit II [Candidatus Paceibacterota bacterium]
MDLNLFWFVLLGVLLAGYAILDGFDLGVGILHPFVRTDAERRILMNSIGPLWDGNEVWLVTFGGALFAAFPEVYATVFSGFYTPFMALLFALIFRAVSMEFRSKRESPAWRRFWDWSFFGGSALATFLFGVAVGNAMQGMPIGPDREFQGGTLDLVRPYPLLIGALAVATFALHGSLYLHLKTEGELQQRVHRWNWRAFGIFLVLYLFVTIYTLVQIPLATRNFERQPWVWIVVALNILAVGNIPRAIYRGRPLAAFFSSCATIAALTFFFGVALFPELVHSSLNPAWSLDVYNAASSQKTLAIMRNIAFLGMPFVLAYTAVIFWVFRGKVKIGHFSY